MKKRKLRKQIKPQKREQNHNYEDAYQYPSDGDGHPSDRDWQRSNRNKGDGHPNAGDW